MGFTSPPPLSPPSPHADINGAQQNDAINVPNTQDDTFPPSGAMRLHLLILEAYFVFITCFHFFFAM